MKPLNNSFAKEFRKYGWDLLSETQEAYIQEVIKRLQEAGSQRKQRMQFLKILPNLDLQTLTQNHLKKLTILHSNDLHGDFFAERKYFRSWIR